MLNKIDIYKYFNDITLNENLCLIDLCIKPSKELVEKWKPMLEFHSLQFQQYMFNSDDTLSMEAEILKEGAPVFVPPIVNTEDMLEASRIFEVVEMACSVVFPSTGSRFNKKTKWLLPRIRIDLNKQPIELIEKQELTFEI